MAEQEKGGMSLNLSAAELKQLMDSLKAGEIGKGGAGDAVKGGGSCGVAVCGNGAAL